MVDHITIKINFRGGIISPGDLYNILVAAGKAKVTHVSFGLRQQLLVEVSQYYQPLFTDELDQLQINYQNNNEECPNIVSSYPAEEVFINNTWLSEGVYKDIFDAFDYTPRLKINVSDSNQSFTPVLTGNINWVAAADSPHYWHVFIRFPKTNIVYEWNQLVYTNDVARFSKTLENIIVQQTGNAIINPQAKGEALFADVVVDDFITKPAVAPAALPIFNLPYYEGLNRYNNKYWLGVYRRDERFNIHFLKAVCRLCLETKIGQLCSTPWKTIIIKGIEETDRAKWNQLLEAHQINMRHAANELNFQVEDNSAEGLALKIDLVKYLNRDDIRTFGICFGIKTRTKSEVFSTILIRRRSVLNIFGWKPFHVYDILCAKNFNPNERTGSVFSSGNPRFLLAEQLRRAVISYYTHRNTESATKAQIKNKKTEPVTKKTTKYIYQCTHCLSVYDEPIGEPENNVDPNTAFNDLPENYCCSLCEAPKDSFVKKDAASIGLQTV